MPVPVVPVPEPISQKSGDVWFKIAVVSLILNGLFLTSALVAICLFKNGKIVLNCLPVRINNANLNINALGGSTSITNNEAFSADFDVSEDEIV